VDRREFVFSSACACLAVAAARIGLARAASASHYRCGTWPPTPSEDIQATRVIEALRAHRVTFRGKTVIPVRFHIIHVGAQGYLPHRRLKAQVALLNRIYAPAGLAFTIADARLHENKAWFTHEPGSPAEIEMKTELARTPRAPQYLYGGTGRRAVGLRTSCRGRRPARRHRHPSARLERPGKRPLASFPVWRL
jgi:hypothetical protein